MAVSKLAGSVALIALMAGAPMMAAAQQTAAPDAASGQAQPGTPNPTAPDTPALIAALDLAGLQGKTRRDGTQHHEGRLPDGTRIKASFDMAGNLIAIEADDGALPAQAVEAALPAETRGHLAMSLLTRITEIKTHPQGARIEGFQGQGYELKLGFGPKGALIGAEMDDRPLPQDLIDEVLPQAVRQAEVVTQFAQIRKVASRFGRYVVEGRDSAGEDMRAELDEAGTVLRFGRDDGRTRGRDRHGKAPRHEDQRADRHHGPRGDGPRGERRHGDGGHGVGAGGWRAQGDGPEGARAGAPGGPRFDTVAANRRLTEAGYTALGLLRAQGPRVMIEATNPQGEPVMLELGPDGEVIRETAR